MTSKVDILFKVEEMSQDRSFAKREKQLRNIQINSTSFGRLKEMARFQLGISGDLELWLLDEDGYASPMDLDLMQPISVLITKDSIVQVEKRDHHYNNQGHLHPRKQANDVPSVAKGKRFAFLSWLSSSAEGSKRSELADAEMAQKLSMELNGIYSSNHAHQASFSPRSALDDETMAQNLSLEWNGMCSNRHEYESFPTCWHNASSPPLPSRSSGEIIARATCSQFAIEGGQSACTSICLYAAAQLLESIYETPTCITTDILDVFLHYGSMFFRRLDLHRGGDHTSVDDLWNHPLYAEIVRPLQRGTVIHGTTSRSSFQECLQKALCFADSIGEQSVALVVTKPPETILLFCKHVHRNGPWFLFDSHGHIFENPKRAYVVQCNSMETAAAALLDKFPRVDGLGDSLHAQTMNMFEAHAIVFKPLREADDLQLLELRKDDLKANDADSLHAAHGQPLMVERDDSRLWGPSKDYYIKYEATSLHEPQAYPLVMKGAEARLLEPSKNHSTKSEAAASNAAHGHPLVVKGNDLQLSQLPKDDPKVYEKSSLYAAHRQPLVVKSDQSRLWESAKDYYIKFEAASFPTPHEHPLVVERDESRLLEDYNNHPTQRETASMYTTYGQPMVVDNSGLLSADALTKCNATSWQTAQRQPPVAKSDESRLLEPSKNDSRTCYNPSLQAPQGISPLSDDLFRDPITGELFADPVFCDKGHTHERSSIERHFQARREMKADEEKRLSQTQGGGVSAEETCGAGRNFDPTCPLTGEPVSEVLIFNDQCDRMVQYLVESGQLALEVGELEEWKQRREEKTRLAQERRAQAPLQQIQESSHQESQPPVTMTINADTVLIQGQTENREGHFFLGVAVALCPSDWNLPDSAPVLIPRCSNSCCRNRLQPSNQGTCARCTRALCSTCLVFHVKEVEQSYADALDNERRHCHHAICPDCVLQISQSLRLRSDTDSDSQDCSQLLNEIDELMEQFFASLMNQKAALQHQVIHYRKHNSFETDGEILYARIEEFQQTRRTLEIDILQAQEQAKAAANVDTDGSESENASPALEFPTSDEVRLQIHISDLSAELDTIDWTTEEGMIRGSLLEHQHNEAIVELGIAQSLKTETVDMSENSATSLNMMERINDLESRCAAVTSEHDTLLERGPSNEHDFEFTVRVSELMHMYEQLSAELIQARDELEKSNNTHGTDTNCTTCETENDDERGGFVGKAVASLLTRLKVTAFAGKKSASSSARASSRVPSPTSDNVRDDVRSSSNAKSHSLTTPKEEAIDLIVPTLNESTVAIATVDLAAIGVIGIEEVIELPFDLRYPSVRIRHQVLVVRNNLELAQIESERTLDEYYGGLRQQIQTRLDELQDELATMRREVASAQAIAEEEERLRQERVARRAAAERERKRLEAERAAELRRLRQEQERLEAVRRKEEEETRQSLRGLDLRRCGNPVCGFGPFEKFNCNDMGAHNDLFTFIDMNGRRQTRRRNECPQCKWTNVDWHAWPRFEA